MTNKLFQMKPIKMGNGFYIKPITDFEDFSKVIDVFKEWPFDEPLTLEDKKEEYNGYLKNGLCLGFYHNTGDIMGLAGLMHEVEEEHEEYFAPQAGKLNPFYIYGLATLPEYRGHGVCTTLMEVIHDIALENNIDFIYLRTQLEGSMSEGLCRKLGYTDMCQNSKKIVQTVTFERGTTGEIGSDDRQFLIYPISEEGKEILVETGSIVPEKSKVKKLS